LLEHESDIEVIGEAETGRQAVTKVKSLRPAVVVMDIAMPLLNGLEATRQIHKDHPETKVLILSAHGEDAYAEEAAAFGAVGFLIKQSSAHTLAQAIREVQKGNKFFRTSTSKRIEKLRLGVVDRGGDLRKKRNLLSSREVEVLQLIAEGKPSKQMATELGVSFKTVDKHRQHLMGKLNIHDVASLTRYAIDEGIIESHVRVTIK